MLFSSALFVFLFLPVVLAGYFLMPRILKNTWLLLVSFLFYAWGETLMSVILLVSIVANYLFGLWVARARLKGSGRGVVATAVVFNVAMLVAFKYADWLWDTVGLTLNALGILSEPLARLGDYFPPDSPLRSILLDKTGHIHLPIGVSFFTFQATSYVIDIFRGDVPAERSLINFGMYKSFFPQLIAGPIVRYRDVHEQVHRRRVTIEGFAYGIRRFVIGLGKKMLIANVCAKCADGIYGNPQADVAGIPVEQLVPSVAWLGIVCYTLQIYFDFSGYSDMAIGLAKMFGFTFLENFNYPYISKSITEFWRRWHISLSSWFRDYLYIPLGGSRRGKGRTYANLVIVFFLCGLWHGANFTFLVWGLFHGAFLVIERVGLAAWFEKRPRALQHVYTVFVVMIGWVFFRALTLDQAFSYLGTMFFVQNGTQLVPVGELQVAANLIHHVDLYADALTWTAIVAGVIGAMPWLPRAVRWHAGLESRGKLGWSIGLEIASLAALSIIFVRVAMDLAAGAYNPFIYFRF
jgi:alginate O-acetyltransferase complex protein AlgI